MPKAPPKTAAGLKAWVKIAAKNQGIRVKLQSTRTTTVSTYTTAIIGTNTSVTFDTFLIPPKLIIAVTTISTAKDTQYSAELVAKVVPVTTPAMAPTAEMVLKPCAGKQRNA